jgi:putative ABC transport system permease protein
MRRLGTGVARWRLLELREVRVHWRRSSIIVVIISAAVGLMVGVFTTYGSISDAVASLAADTAGSAALAVRGTTSTIDANVLDSARSVVGVATAVPVVQQQVDYRSDGASGSTLVMGSNPSVAQLKSRLSAALTAEVLADPGVLLGRDTVVVGPNFGARMGQKLSFGEAEVTVGKVAGNRDLNGGNYVLAPLPLAQKIADMTAQVSTIYIVADRSTDISVLERDLKKVVGGALVSRPDFQVEQVAQSTSLLTNAALLVALIAFVVAAFLIYNTLHMAVAQKRRSMSVLRAIGAQPSTLYRDLLYSSVIYAVVGSVLGITLGLVAGRVVINFLPPFVLQSVSAEVQYSANTLVLVVAFFAALSSCLAASFMAGLQIYRVAPVEALAGTQAVVAPRVLRSTALTAAGAGVIAGSFWTAGRADEHAALAAAVMLLLGTIILLYGLSRPLVGICVTLLSRAGGIGSVAAAGVARNPARSWSSIVTLVIAVGVAVGASGALTSMADSTTRSMGSLQGTDLFVTRTPSDVLPAGASIPDRYVEIVRSTADVAKAVPGRWLYADFNGDQVTIQGIAPGSRAVTLQPLTHEIRQRVLAGDGVVISEQLAKRQGLQAGDAATLTTPTGVHHIHVLDVAPYISIANGTVAMSLAQLHALYPHSGTSYLEVTVNSGANGAAVERNLRERLPPEAYVYDGHAALAGTTAAVAQAGLIAVALQWMVGAVAAVGIFNIFNLTVMERRRELGTLRAIGANSSQTMRMVILEALATAVVGGTIGYLLGIGVHYLACMALNATTTIPVNFSYHPISLALAALGVAICLLGSIVPALRESRLPVIRALADD